MNLICTLGRMARILAALAAAVLTATATMAAALATPRPRPPGWNKHPGRPASTHPAINYYPPGWNKHPPLPAHAHTLAAGGLPGWQLTLIAVLALLLAIALAVTYRLRAARRRISATTA